MKNSTETTIYDPLRKKHVAATPEEQVRQKMIEYLHSECKWPLGLMNSEVEISNDIRYRCDIVCYDKTLTPRVVVECKAPDVPITQKTFDQIWRYAIILKTTWVIVTNGVSTFVCKWNSDNQNFEFVTQFPQYNPKHNGK